MICKICEKNVPNHIMPAHIKKSHPKPVVVPGNPNVVGIITPEAASTSRVKELEAKIKELEKKLNPVEKQVVPDHLEFDWNKAETCVSCGEIHPSILMRYHAHITHGV